MKSRKTCWTCTARKVQCDGGSPNCQKCSRGGRKCQGYQTRLSWPRDGDKKRAIIADVPQLMHVPQETNAFFINTTWRDVEMHVRDSPQDGLPVPPATVLWKQPQLSASHIELIHYFHTTAYLSLITYGVNPSKLRDILLRIAMKDGTAVLHALLAFSSLHLHGLTQETIHFKISTLHVLSISAEQEILSLAEAVQHVAASMLLFSFDILTPSSKSNEWLAYIWGALKIIETTHLKSQPRSTDADIAYLIDWLEYHNFMSRFSIHHERYDNSPLKAPYIQYPSTKGGVGLESLMRYRPAIPAPNPTYFIHTLLSEIYTSMPSPLFSSHLSTHQTTSQPPTPLDSLIQKVSTKPLSPLSTTFGADDDLAREVYILCIRIYSLRASYLSDIQSFTSPSQTSSHHLSSHPSSQPNPSLQPNPQINNPHNHLLTLFKIFNSPTLPSHACGHFLPSYILACEARDSQRGAILSLLDTVERKEAIGGVGRLREWIGGAWVRRDLRDDGEGLDGMGMEGVEGINEGIVRWGEK